MTGNAAGRPFRASRKDLECINMLRYVGDVEKFGTVQHFLGYYKCVAVTAKYTTKIDPRRLGLSIESALTKVVLQHPTLCVGIIREDTEKPAFVRLHSINLTKCVEYLDVLAFTPGEYNAALENILERQHSRPWPELSCRPGWKIIVVQSKAIPSTKTAFDIIFAYHHALADGVSGLVFHRCLLEALNSTMHLGHLDRRIAIPKVITLPLPLEKQLSFTISMPFYLREVWKASKPAWMAKCLRKTAAWTGTPSSPLQIQNYKSRSKIISIGAYQLALILASCGRQNATLTGLLHGIIVISLTSHVPKAKRFNAGLPYSLRHQLDENTKNGMGCYAWGSSVGYSAETISRIRSTGANAQLTNEIWDIVRTFSSAISAELNHLPKDSVIGLLPRNNHFHKAFQSQVGKPRPETFEVSNIGVFKNGTKDEKWKIEKMIFSQSGIATGAAISFNVVSVAGGPLTICATWMEGAIEETLVSLVCGDIIHILGNLSRVIATCGGIQHPGSITAG